jgi:hypothetical protein
LQVKVRLFFCKVLFPIDQIVKHDDVSLVHIINKLNDLGVFWLIKKGQRSFVRIGERQNKFKANEFLLVNQLNEHFRKDVNGINIRFPLTVASFLGGEFGFSPIR